VRFPHHPAKHARPALFTPQPFLAYRRRLGAPIARAPPQIVLGFAPNRVRRAAARLGARPIPDATDLFVSGRGPAAIGLAATRGVGGPALAIAVEELAAIGARRFLSVGFAGSLAAELEVGTTVLCSRALRDEGTSFHYARPSTWAWPTRELYLRLADRLRRLRVPFAVGSSWTVDAPYRETIAEVRSVRARGVRTVEMEASAPFTVARVRGRQSAALLTVSDLLDERGWTPRPTTRSIDCSRSRSRRSGPSAPRRRRGPGASAHAPRAPEGARFNSAAARSRATLLRRSS